LKLRATYSYPCSGITMVLSGELFRWGSQRSSRAAPEDRFYSVLRLTSQWEVRTIIKQELLGSNPIPNHTISATTRYTCNNNVTIHCNELKFRYIVHLLWKAIVQIKIVKSQFNLTKINSLEQSTPCNADSRSDSREMFRILCNPKFHYRSHKSPPPSVTILSYMETVHTLTHYFFTIHFNIVLWSTSRSSNWSLFFRLSSQNFVRIVHMRATFPVNLNIPWFNRPNKIWRTLYTDCVDPHNAFFSIHLSLHPFWSKYSAQHPVLKHPQSVILL
jgi:hypothetical protein